MLVLFDLGAGVAKRLRPQTTRAAKIVPTDLAVMAATFASILASMSHLAAAYVAEEIGEDAFFTARMAEAYRSAVSEKRDPGDFLDGIKEIAMKYQFAIHVGKQEAGLLGSEFPFGMLPRPLSRIYYIV
jgi:hypothetical protein